MTLPMASGLRVILAYPGGGEFTQSNRLSKFQNRFNRSKMFFFNFLITKNVPRTYRTPYDGNWFIG